MVEKPFGTDLASARHLNEIVSGAFPEASTYRIDHFLGKETAQNIMVLRFANAIFEPIWNSRYIDHIEITAAETLGVEGRAGYYETSGALRDMVQNHLIQLLTLVCMEPPTDLGADSVRGEKVKVLRSLRQFKSADDVRRNVVRGQYAAGAINGQSVPAYRTEPNVKPGSMTETFVAMRVLIDNWRWSGVPIYVRVGKRLPKSGAEISVFFKRAPSVLFNEQTSGNDEVGGNNVLVIRIQPDEGVSAADAEQAARGGVAGGAGEDGLPVRRELRQGEPGGLRAAAARRHERRPDAVCPARRGGGGLAFRRRHRAILAWHDRRHGHR